MPSTEFRTRLEHVLAARVEARKAEEHSSAQRLVQGMGVIVGTLACFFFLKAAALAHDGQAFAALGGDANGFGAQLHHWFAGADPISSTLSHALREGAPAPAMPATGTL